MNKPICHTCKYEGYSLESMRKCHRCKAPKFINYEYRGKK